jgi:hypothetical protein
VNGGSGPQRAFCSIWNFIQKVVDNVLRVRPIGEVAELIGDKHCRITAMRMGVDFGSAGYEEFDQVQVCPSGRAVYDGSLFPKFVSSITVVQVRRFCIQRSLDSC